MVITMDFPEESRYNLATMGTDHKNKKSFLVGISQINTTLGNFILNRQRILSDVQRASRDGCKLVVFPETTLFGYHPFDMLERPALVEAQLAEMFYIQKSLPAGKESFWG